MLLSFKYRFIFIKTKKTAGTSLEIAFSPYANGQDDVITPVTPEDEALRAAQRITPRNYAKAGVDPTTLDTGQMRFWNHIPASDIKKELPDIWNGFLKITSERHPYEKAVSLAWYHFPGQRRHAVFADYLDYIIDGGDYYNWPRYSIDGKIAADVIIRYEHLLPDTNSALARLGLPGIAALPSAKSRFRQDKRLAADILSPHQKSRIQSICAREFEYFNYPY